MVSFERSYFSSENEIYYRYSAELINLSQHIGIQDSYKNFHLSNIHHLAFAENIPLSLCQILRYGKIPIPK